MIDAYLDAEDRTGIELLTTRTDASSQSGANIDAN